MRARAVGFVALLTLGGAAVTSSRGAPEPTIRGGGTPRAENEPMARAARAFLDGLTPDRRARAVFALDDEERFDWHFVPRERNGLPLADMSRDDRVAAHRLLGAGLSAGGYLKATGVMQLEAVLGAIEGRPERRDPERYYLSIFGSPSAGEPWGWRFEGHHLSLNFTVAGEAPAATTPAFLGANPATVGDGPFAGWRLLGAEEDLARTLLGMLPADRRARAVISDRAPRDIITGAERRASLERYEGLPASEMSPEERQALWRLIGEYLHDFPPDIARTRADRIRAAGEDRLFFAWAGSLDRGAGHYYRVHGPTFLIEYDNTQNGANHVHAVVRDFENDFGDDLLRRHYEESDHHRRPPPGGAPDR